MIKGLEYNRTISTAQLDRSMEVIQRTAAKNFVIPNEIILELEAQASIEISTSEANIAECNL
jgi:hypothetical protein